MKRATILVTDGHLRSSLAVVRSLGRAGHRVFVCSPRKKSLAGASRYAAAEYKVPESLTHPDAFADAIVTLARRLDVSILMPMSEESLLALLGESSRLQGVDIPFATLDAFTKASDKEYEMRLAASMGMAVPEQVVVPTRPNGTPLHTGALRFPVVVKPARTVSGTAYERAKFGVTYAADRRALDGILSSLPSGAFPVLLQERIQGPGTGIFLLVWDSRVIAQFAHVRIREKPPSGGVSVCAESIAPDPTAMSQSRALLAALEWRGPAMVEFKQDHATGRRYLMEINGRFWGSLQLAIDAGVDFPALLVAATLGEEPKPVTQYETGVRCRWWWGEVDHLIARLRRKSGWDAAGGRSDALKRFFAPGRGVKNEVLRADDPLPFLRESIDWVRRR